MSDRAPPPVKKFGKLYASHRYVMQQFGDKPGSVTDSVIAECYRSAITIAQAKRYAKLFAAAPSLLAFVTKCAAFDDEGANNLLAKGGGYAGFDNPGTVEEARELLASLK